MNHSNKSSSGSTMGVPSLPSVISPLAGYRYAKSVGDRDMMITEAMKFRGKLYDEKVKMQESYNKELKKAQAKVDEAKLNFEIAKYGSKVRDIHISQLEADKARREKEVVDARIDAKVAKGSGSEARRAVEAHEKSLGRPSTQWSDSDWSRFIRLHSKKPLTDAQAIMAAQGIRQGLQVTDEQMTNISGGARGASRSSSRTGAGSSHTTGELNDIASKNIVNRIVANIRVPERIDTWWGGKNIGDHPPSSEMWDMTLDLIEELRKTDTLPGDMRTRIQGLENDARRRLADLQSRYPDKPIFTKDTNGRLAMHSGVDVQNKSTARHDASLILFLDSPEGQYFKRWLDASSSAGSYIERREAPPSGAGTQPGDDSGNVFKPGGDGGGEQPKPKKPRRPRRPQKLEAGGEAETAIRKSMGIDWGVGDWVNPPAVWRDEAKIHHNTYEAGWVHLPITYKILEFQTTGDPKNPFRIKAEKYSDFSGIRRPGWERGKLRKQVVYISADQIDGFEKRKGPPTSVIEGTKQNNPPRKAREGYYWTKHPKSGKWIERKKAAPPRPERPSSASADW